MTTSRLRFYPAQHTYRLADPETGKQEIVPGVSKLKTMCYPPGFQLEKWRRETAAQAIAEHISEIAALPMTARAAEIDAVGESRVNEPREYGKAFHKYAEHLWTGEPVEVPEQFASGIRALADWYESEHIEVIAYEQLLFADGVLEGEYPQCAYAGTTDLVVKHPKRGVGLLDLKTGKNPMYAESQHANAFQLVAYSSAEKWSTPDGDTVAPPIDWHGVLHCTVSGVRLWTLSALDVLLAADKLATVRMVRAAFNPHFEEALA